ncbi:unnamed protein product [Pleuronectes platessa]|uniref:Uncharacterized protein n=1 Tax=Pleuronectes platessa TaxID=8262 RepID=A0A9N7VDP1_PLEPL|nr:unnamed protein product [Pleuronectes platessa]
MSHKSVKNYQGRKAATASLSYIAKGGAWLIQLPSLSNPKPERRNVLQENFNQHLSTRLDRMANAELYDHKARRQGSQMTRQAVMRQGRKRKDGKGDKSEEMKVSVKHRVQQHDYK